MRTLALVLPVAVLVSSASPIAAQDSSRPNLCLRAEGSAMGDVSDPEVLTAMIAVGDITLVEVIPCAPVPVSGSGPGWEGITTGAWFVSDIKPNPAAGETSAIAGTEAHLGTSSTGQPYLLSLRCIDDEIDLQVGWHDVIETEQPTVEVVTGSGASQQEPWNRSTDHESTFYPGQLVASFVESLYGETSLIVRVRPDGGPPWTAAFDIEGIEQALANVWAACGS